MVEVAQSRLPVRVYLINAIDTKEEVKIEKYLSEQWQISNQYKIVSVDDTKQSTTFAVPTEIVSRTYKFGKYCIEKHLYDDIVMLRKNTASFSKQNACVSHQYV